MSGNKKASNESESKKTLALIENLQNEILKLKNRIELHEEGFQEFKKEFRMNVMQKPVTIEAAKQPNDNFQKENVSKLEALMGVPINPEQAFVHNQI